MRMRRVIPLLLSGTALALPTMETAGAAASLSGSRHAAVSRTTKFTGASANASQWGSVQINVTLRTTVTGKKVARKFTDLGGTYSYHTSRSQYIMSQALPILRQEFLAAQSANVQNVSGATYTSEAFVQSLQSALLKAHA
jgi:uncharacterized protein with FMN-binding domain